MARLFFSHGDKGGIGKSMLSAILVDKLLLDGKDVGLIEGDVTADIATRFLDEDIAIAGVDLNRSGDAESSIIKFSDALEQMQGKNVVVNFPAAAGETLEQYAEALISVTEDMGYEPYAFFSLGHQEPGTKNALRSLNGGLMGNMDKKRVCMVYPGFLGDPEGFHWVTSGNRDKYDLNEVIMPQILPKNLAMKILSLQGRFSIILQKDTPGLTLIEKALLRTKWFNSAIDAVSIFDK